MALVKYIYPTADKFEAFDFPGVGNCFYEKKKSSPRDTAISPRGGKIIFPVRFPGG